MSGTSAPAPTPFMLDNTFGKVLIRDGSNTGNHSLAVLAPLRNVAFLVTTNGYDPAGCSRQTPGRLQERLITFHNTGR